MIDDEVHDGDVGNEDASEVSMLLFTPAVRSAGADNFVRAFNTHEIILANPLRSRTQTPVHANNLFLRHLVEVSCRAQLKFPALIQ